MTQLASAQAEYMTGMEILEELYMEENEETVDLVIEILDSHFGYDDDFFCESDHDYREIRGDPYKNFYTDEIYEQAT